MLRPDLYSPNHSNNPSPSFPPPPSFLPPAVIPAPAGIQNPGNPPAFGAGRWTNHPQRGASP